MSSTEVKIHRFTLSLILCLFLVFTPQGVSGRAQSLPAFNVNTNLTSVSGLSSGGFMAVQLHVAYSSMMIGVGVFAGGQYNCAEGSASKAIVSCMSATPPPDPQNAVKTTLLRSDSGSIDDVSYLTNQRVYLFSGSEDTTVKTPVVEALQTYYEHFVSGDNAIVFDNSIGAAHTFPTIFQSTNNCGQSKSPYISYCGYDGAGYALNHIFDYQLHPRSSKLTGELIEFDQTEFYSKSMASISMADTGYAYIPSACSLGASCYVHVALHGCLQSSNEVGTDFVKYSGYNEWAETNNIIVLYPQTIPSTFNPQNPNSCWDWWGYTSSHNYDIKSGAQMEVIKAMIDRIGDNFIGFNLTAPSNLSFLNSTDHSIAFEWSPVPSSSGYIIYRNSVFLDQLFDPSIVIFNDISQLSSGTQYEYSVASFNSFGQLSPPSPPLFASTTGTPPPLLSPSNLSASDISSTSVVLKWEYVLGADRYNVYRNSQFLATTDQNTYTDLSLSPSTTYSYTINAENSYSVGPFSSPLYITTNAAFQCVSFADNNYNHVIKGRAYSKFGYAYANGSDDYLGLFNIFVYSIVSETSPGFYVLGSCM